MNMLTLHLGLHKTGTTYIQAGLAGNGEALIRQRLAFYRDAEYVDAWYAHHTLAVSVRDEPHPDIVLVERRDQIWERFLRWMETVAGSHVLISSEVFLEGVDLDYVHKQLARYRPTLLFYLREEAGLFESSYCEKVRHGCALPVATFYDQERSLLDYHHHIRPWAEVFGWDAIRVRSYDEVQRRKGDLLLDFLHAVGLPESADDRIQHLPGRVHARPPEELLELLRRYNALPLTRDEKMAFRDHVNNLQHTSEAMRALPPFRVSDEMRDRIRKDCRPQNEPLWARCEA